MGAVVRDTPEAYATCYWCPTAFDDVYLANLTYFQIITGDGWADLTRPFIEHHWWAFMFVSSCIFVVTWGLLNLIVAAIVDSAVSAREADIAIGARDALLEQESAWALFNEFCTEIDADNSGTISVEEFRAAWQSNSELQEQLCVMGVEPAEFQGLIEIMDSDGNGVLSTDEFVKQLFELRTHVLKTSLYYVLKYVEKINRGMEAQAFSISQMQQILCTKGPSTVETCFPATAAAMG